MASLGVNLIENVIGKITCSEMLEVWNRRVFERISKNINQSRKRIQLLQVSHCIRIDDHKEARFDLQKWIEREEIMWRQI